MPDDAKPVAAACGQKLADWRLKRGLTQTALARQIGVSRQFLNQLESGRVLPNVVIALRLAASLEHTVEELFGNAAVAADECVPVDLAEPGLLPGTRLRLGRVGRTWIAHPADTPNTLSAGFTAADAVLELGGRARLLQPLTAVGSNLLIAGCDPALALLQSTAEQGPGSRYHWIDCGSSRALDLLAAEKIHVAGIHYSGSDGSGNLSELKQRDPKRRWCLVRFTRWEQGWIIRKGAGRTFAGVASLKGKKWTLANRDVSAAARRWLDRELDAVRIDPAGIPGYSTCVASATEGARAIASGQADVTVGPQALALAHGLDFVPAEAVDFDLVALGTWWRSAAGRELRRRIAGLADSRVLTSLPGYASTEPGTERERTQKKTS